MTLLDDDVGDAEEVNVKALSLRDASDRLIVYLVRHNYSKYPERLDLSKIDAMVYDIECWKEKETERKRGHREARAAARMGGRG